jgi:hypothetical protein
MAKFFKKLVKGVGNKIVDNTLDRTVGRIFGTTRGGRGRTFGFGGLKPDPRFQPTPGLKNYRDIFWWQLTNDFNFSTPHRSLWYVVINGFPVNITQSVLDPLEKATVDGYTPPSNPNLDSTYNLLVGKGMVIPNHDGLKAPDSTYTTSPQGNQDSGCLFAQGVRLPQESMTVARPMNSDTMGQRGFIGGVVSKGRGEFQRLTIEFRETATSFVDVVLRPWLVLASHYGLVSRPPGDPKNVKTQIDVYQLAVQNGKQLAPIIRKHFTFYNCVPVTIAQQGATYDVDSGAMEPVDTQWVYSHYRVSTGTPVPEPGPFEAKSNDFSSEYGGLDHSIAADKISSQFETGSGGMGSGLGGMPGLKY